MTIKKLILTSTIIILLFAYSLVSDNYSLAIIIIALPAIWMYHYRNISAGWFWLLFLGTGTLIGLKEELIILGILLENTFISVMATSINFLALIFAIRKSFFVRRKKVEIARQETKHELGTFANNQETIKKGRLFKGLIKKMTARRILIVSIVAFLLLILGGGMLYANYIQGRVEVSKKNVELREKELKLSQEKLEYQKKKDAEAKEEKIVETRQDEIKNVEDAQQANWNRARAECVAIADKNYKSFSEALDGCQTTECQNNMINNKELQYFGEGFIENCTQNRL